MGSIDAAGSLANAAPLYTLAEHLLGGLAGTPSPIQET